MTFIHTAAWTEAPSTSEGSLDAWGWVRGPSSRLPLPPVTRPIHTGAPVLDTGTPRPTPTPLTKGFPVLGHVWCVWMELSFHIPHPSKFSSFIISTIATITLTMINFCIYLLVSTPEAETITFWSFLYPWYLPQISAYTGCSISVYWLLNDENWHHTKHCCRGGDNFPVHDFSPYENISAYMLDIH